MHLKKKDCFVNFFCLPLKKWGWNDTLSSYFSSGFQNEQLFTQMSFNVKKKIDREERKKGIVKAQLKRLTEYLDINSIVRYFREERKNTTNRNVEQFKLKCLSAIKWLNEKLNENWNNTPIF